MAEPTTARSPQNAASDLYKNLFDHMNDGIAYCKIIYDGEGKPVDFLLLNINLAFKRLTRLPEKLVLNRKASDFMPLISKNYDDWLKKCTQAVYTHKCLSMEKKIPLAGKWLSFTACMPQKGYFAMIIKDITWRKNIEEALRQGEKKYKKLANSITTPFFALDSSLKFIYWNKSSEKYTGISSANVVGKHFFEVFGKNRGTSKISRVYLDVMKTKKSRVLTEGLPNVANDIFFEYVINPTGNGVSVLAKDITESKKLQFSLEEYARRLEELVRVRTEKLRNAERLATIGETAGMIGHDIRNPLQSVIGELFLAKGTLQELPETEAKESLLASVNSIEEQMLYINKIVTDLQDYAKPLTPAIQECDLEQTIQEITLGTDVPVTVKINCYILKPFPTLKQTPHSSNAFSRI